LTQLFDAFDRNTIDGNPNYFITALLWSTGIRGLDHNFGHTAFIIVPATFDRAFGGRCPPYTNCSQAHGARASYPHPRRKAAETPTLAERETGLAGPTDDQSRPHDASMSRPQSQHMEKGLGGTRSPN